MRRLALLGSVLCLALGPIAARAARIVVGRPAPDFHATAFDGTKVALADYRGQVLVLNFWATWCAPCREELPLLDVYYRIQKRFGLRVLAVTTEDSAPMSALKPLSTIVSFQMARRFSGGYGDPKAVPTNYVIDRAGIVRYAAAGAFTLDELNEILIPLLKEPPPPDLVAPASVAAAAP